MPLCTASSAEIPVAVATQHGAGRPLTSGNQSPDQLPDSSVRQSAAGRNVASAEGGGVGVHAGHRDGAEQPLLYHCQGERFLTYQVALNNVITVKVRRDYGPFG